MPRIVLIPSPTSDGRRIVLRAVAVRRGDGLRRLAARLGLRLPAPAQG